MTTLSMRNELKPAVGASLEQTDPTRSFRELVVAYTPDLLRILRSLGVRADDLDDVCQEVFIVVHRQLSTFQGRSSLSTWLYGIALRVASGYRNKAYRRRERPATALPEASLAAAQESDLQVKEAWALMETLLAPLSEQRRQVFVLYEIGQLSVPEIAEVLDCPVQTTYSRLHAARQQVERALAKLRRELQP